ncbi:hypothetical protein BDY21DRAFT_135544 [Lineolata rhizophorae]|uniref:Uncharacterized protein n=1 Tax=Lineolata rhizophorae TaxID=578093 RepID=A0A6A6PAN6_9PEZI|nr:hypothetical protein BDY21DRAFT_135544 [Lineolata rhizophorae]
MQAGVLVAAGFFSKHTKSKKKSPAWDVGSEEKEPGASSRRVGFPAGLVTWIATAAAAVRGLKAQGRALSWPRCPGSFDNSQHGGRDDAWGGRGVGGWATAARRWVPGMAGLAVCWAGGRSPWAGQLPAAGQQGWLAPGRGGRLDEW